jgi:EAL domain-containing protein (putative c-di-GMP-specific phosphodiesterase class I)
LQHDLQSNRSQRSATRRHLPAGLVLLLGFALSVLWFGWQGLIIIGFVAPPLLYLASDSWRSTPSGPSHPRPLDRTATARPSGGTDPTPREPMQHARTLFQPQISTHSGMITGFSAVPACNTSMNTDMAAPLSASEIAEDETPFSHFSNLTHALHRAKTLQRTSHFPLIITCSLSTEQVDDVQLAAKLEWELDRLDVKPATLRLALPQHLCQHTPSHPLISTCRDLRTLGCGIALYGFGSGPHCVEIIQKCGVDLAIIDPSLTNDVDKHPNRRRILSAVVAMAHDLGVETLACDIRTAGEHSLLSQLGCDHVQGDGIAPPMQIHEATTWMHTHSQKLTRLPGVVGGIR